MKLEREVAYRGDIGRDGNTEPFRVEPRDGVSQTVIDMLQATPHMELAEGPRAQGMIIRDKTKFTDPGSFEPFPELSYVVRAGVGVDNINMKLAAEAGIGTVNTPGASTDPVAQRAMTLMLAWAARLRQAMEALQRHEWSKGRPEIVPIDLSEKTLGVIGGGGRIGEQIRARAASIFGNVLWSDLRADVEGPGKTDTDTLLRQSDVVALAVDGGGEILTPEKLALIRDGGLVVNTSRGTNVNTEALLTHMDERSLHAALDVFPGEGPDMFSKHPHLTRLVDHPNFVGTPHTAASNPVAQRELGKEAVARMVAYAQEGTINPAGIRGHTLPAVSLSNGHVLGIRAVLFHQSRPGVLESITHSISKRGLNIHSLRNGEGPDKLAATLVHVQEATPDQALQMLNDIRREVNVYRARLMHFA
jgi:phosphoglycerate dehydrogenase-like enzyme